MMYNTLFSILDSNPTKNIAILGFFSNHPVKEYFVEGNTFLILGKSDHLWAHISGSSEIELSLILAKYHKKTKYYFSVEDWMIPIILKYGTLDWQMITNRFVLDEDVFLNTPKFDIIKIDKKYSAYIYNNSDYKKFLTIKYIEDRLIKNISAGIFINNILVAWGFTHDDGALGFLNVLQEYRNKGYGTDILLGLIQMKRKLKKYVFGNILQGNIASTKLVTKLGFKLDCKATWIKLK